MLSLIRKLCDVPEDARCNARIQVCTVGNFSSAAECNARIACSDIDRADSLELLCENAGQAPRTLCKKFIQGRRSSKRLEDNKDDNPNQRRQSRNFIEPSIKHVAVGIPIVLEVIHRFAQVEVLRDQHTN